MDFLVKLKASAPPEQRGGHKQRRARSASVAVLYIPQGVVHVNGMFSLMTYVPAHSFDQTSLVVFNME